MSGLRSSEQCSRRPFTSAVLGDMAELKAALDGNAKLTSKKRLCITIKVSNRC